MLSLSVALALAATVYSINSKAPIGGRKRSAILFVLGLLLIGGFVGWIGALLGIDLFCSLYDDPLCGLPGLFIGPISFSLAVGIYLYLWVQNGKIP